MALVIGLVAAAARALASDHNGSNPGYNGNGQNYNNSNNYNNGYRHGCNSNAYNRGYNDGYSNNNNYYSGNNAAPCAPYAAYGTTGSRRSTRRMERRMRKAERKAMERDMITSLMSSGSRSRAAPSQPQPVSGGVSYTNYGEGPAPRGVYSSEAQGSASGSYRDRMPAGAPEGYRWRDEQSRDRSRDLASSSAMASSDGLPSYEQAVQKPRKS